jgi:hypothetical protein
LEEQQIILPQDEGFDGFFMARLKKKWFSSMNSLNFFLTFFEKNRFPTNYFLSSTRHTKWRSGWK